MPNAITVTIDGLDELERALLDSLPKQARSAMRLSLKDAGEFMRDAIAAKAPRKTGFLAEHILVKARTSVRDDEGDASVGPSRDAYYAQFVEFGSIHNQPAHPFIRPAFEENKEGWLDVFADKLRERLGL